MSNSSVSQRVLESKKSLDTSEYKITMSATTQPNTAESNSPQENFIDVNQRIMLPREYNNASQIVKLRITMPKIILVEEDENQQNSRAESNKKRQILQLESNENQGISQVEANIADNAETDEHFETNESMIEFKPVLMSDLDKLVTGSFIRSERETSGTPITGTYVTRHTNPALAERERDVQRRTMLEYKNESSGQSTSIENSPHDVSVNNSFSYKKYISDITSSSLNRSNPRSPGIFNTSFYAYNVQSDVTPKKTVNYTKYSEGIVKAKIKFFETQQFLNTEISETQRVEEVKPVPASKAIEEQVKNFFEKAEYKNIEYRKLPFSHKIRPKTTFDTFKKYMEGLDSSKGTQDSEIIKELVLSRYRDALEHFIDKSGKRKRFSCDDANRNERSIDESPLHWRDSGNNSIDGNHSVDDIIETCERVFSQCDVSSSTSCEDVRDRTFTIEKKVEDGGNDGTSRVYDEEVFLDMALGPEHSVSLHTVSSETSRPSQNPHSDEENSVGTSHLSQLISGAYDLYSHVDYMAKRNKRQSLITYASISDSRQSVDKSRESVEEKPQVDGNETVLCTNNTMDDSTLKDKKEIVEALMTQLSQQTASIVQVSKALDLCGKIKVFYDSVQRVEAERVLLVATLRKEVLIEEMSKVEYEDMNDTRNGNIRLSNIRIPMIWVCENNAKYTRFFVCVFRCGTAVYSSGVLLPNEETMELEIKKCFYFGDLPADFEITVHIYSMYAKIRDHSGSTGRSYKKDCTNIYHNLKQFFAPTRGSIRTHSDEYGLKKPSFILYGKGVINRTSLAQQEFKIDNIYPRIPLANTLKCTIDKLVRLNNDMSGFLTIGESIRGIIMWNRQWCVLYESELKFWDYPGTERDTAPNKVIDLSRCLLQSICQADKAVCSRTRTLYLEIGPKNADEEFSSEDCYLSTDNQEDFIAWKNELNNVLTILIQWGCMKPYFYKN